MGGHFSDLDSVFKFDALNDLWQLVLAFQSPPCFRGGVDKFKHHNLAVFADSAPLSARCDDAPSRTHSR